MAQQNEMIGGTKHRRAIIISTGLRAVSMAAKFILILALARLITPQEVGTFSLVSATVANGVLLMGLQFFLFANRELAAVDRPERGKIIRNQAALYGASYAVVLPLSTLLFFFGILEWSVAPWFYLIMVLDHASYELVRILVSDGRTARANLIHAIRTGFFVIPLLAMMFLSTQFRNLTWVWFWWAAFSAISVGLAAWYLRSMGVLRAFKSKPDWSWVREGLKTSVRYIPVTLSLIAFTALDRYALELLGPGSDDNRRALVGVYGLYVMVGNLVVTFPEAGLVSVLQPLMIRAYRTQEYQELRRLNYKLFFSLAKTGLALCFIAALGLIGALFVFIKEPIYKELLPAFAVVLLGAYLNALAMSPRNLLYAMDDDRSISIMTICGMALFLVLAIPLAPAAGVMGVAAAVAAGYALRLALGLMFARRNLRRVKDLQVG